METVCKHAVFLGHSILVLDNVVVPHFDGVCVVDSLVPHCLHFETSTFKLTDIPVQRARCVSSGEDVFSHEVAPDKILVLPGTTETGDLEEEETVGLEK